MGGCVTGQKLQPENHDNNNQKKKKKYKFSDIELRHLELIYEDLANRCKDKIVNRQIFQLFFHTSGLMTQLLFAKFDQQKTGQISKDQFLKAFQIMVKGNFEQKADALFQFYSVEKCGGIRYSELIKILFSYPLSQLSKMLFEEEFLKFLGDINVAYYFGPERKMQDKTIIQLASQTNTEQQNNICSIYSLYSPDANEIIDMQNKIINHIQEKSKKDKIQLPEIFKKQKDFLKVPQNKIQIQKKKTGSMSLIQRKLIKKQCQLKSNISSITRRYAAYLFTTCNLNKDVDVLSKNQFYKLLKDHSSIFDTYLSGFHTYTWQTNAKGYPQYCQIAAQIEGDAYFLVEKQLKKVYIKLVKTTILVFSLKTSKITDQIINLQGLTVVQQVFEDKKGIKILHRDGFYPQKIFIFDKQQQKTNQWIKALSDYKQLSIFDQYTKHQKIGGGNFANVYRGKQKLTGKQVAIKVIQPRRLSEVQRQILKRQIGILKQSFHPNIIKFIKQYKTKHHIYIVTELLKDGDLFQYTKKNNFLQQYQSAIIFKQIAQAIIYLNQSGIIHRDLKPQNVLIKLNNQRTMVRRVRLIDFGFGVYKDKLKDLPNNQKFAGTPGFIPPQVYLCKQYDEKVDTFSLGIILYFMLSGFLPFQSNYLQQIQQLTLRCNVNLKNNHWSNISQEAKDLISKILTPQQTRISTKQVLNHPWLQNIQKLKQYHGINKKKKILL